MGKKVSGKNTQSAYKERGRCAINRTNRLKRHMKKYPNDAVAAEALANGPDRRRCTPTKKVWGPVEKMLAQLYTSVGLDGSVIQSRKKTRPSN